jgi:3-phenylpropionate/trans-cinnamate dioxygenase ferredoxin subunit
MSDWIDVARLDEFTPGCSRLVDVEDVMVAVFNIDGEFHAIENVCTHDGFPLLDENGQGSISAGEITCPRHGARFCLRTGEAMCPPAYEPVAVFPVRVVDAIVQVRDDRWD